MSIDRFAQRHQLAFEADQDWVVVRRDLDELPRAYSIPWSWTLALLSW
jgi:hypothetical protein